MNLLPHQIETIDNARPILMEHGVVMIAAGCRTGKTAMALTLASELGGPILFVSKKKALGSIRLDADALGVQCVEVNYESLHKVDFEANGAVLIYDECHSLSAFAKPCKAAKALRMMGKKAKAVILLSATPAIEASSQWYHIFWATGDRGPFKLFGTFYRWFKEFGISEKVRIAGGQEVETYKRVRPEVADHVAKFSVVVSQEDAKFKIAPTVIPHLINAPDLVFMGNQIKRDGIMLVEGRTVVAEGPAAQLQKMAMLCGGTLIDDAGEGFVFYGTTKLDYLLGKMKNGRQYAIFTAYIKERDLISDVLGAHGWRCSEDMDALKNGEIDCFVGSLKRYSEGFDLSWLVNGAMVIYSLTFSGTTYHQILNRMIKYDRVDPAIVHVLMIRGSVEEQVFKAVNGKQSFNEDFMEKVRC